MMKLESLTFQVGDILEVSIRDSSTNVPENVVGYYDYHSPMHIRLRNRSPIDGKYPAYYGNNFIDCEQNNIVGVNILKSS